MQVNGFTSYRRSVTSGSVLGHLLFILHANDVFNIFRSVVYLLLTYDTKDVYSL